MANVTLNLFAINSYFIFASVLLICANSLNDSVFEKQLFKNHKIFENHYYDNTLCTPYRNYYQNLMQYKYTDTNIKDKFSYYVYKSTIIKHGK